jgi:hypothetical protein
MMEIKNRDFTVKKTETRTDTRGEFIAVLNPACVPFYLKQNYLVVANHLMSPYGTKEVFRIPVFIKTDETLDTDEIKLDMKVRVAIGANVGDNVQLEPYSFIKSLRKSRLWTIFFGRQVNLLRVKYSTFTDMEIPLCRIDSHVMKTIGVEEGDKIFVESSQKRISIKAFELPQTLVGDRMKKEKNNKSTYGPGKQSEDKKRRELLGRENKSDLPWILLDDDARNELGIHTNDPVRIYRNINHLILKKMHVISIPLILTIIGFVLSLDLFKGNDPLKFWIYLGGLLVVIFLNLLSLRLIIK